jgi:hypothetical protein
VERAPALPEIVIETAMRPTDTTVDTTARSAERVAAATPTAPATIPAPLPGATAVAPMAQLLEARQQTFPPELVQGERQFAAESVDTTWASGAEADILAKFAQMSGLALTSLQVECRSTMCRLQVASPISPNPASPPFNILVDSLDLEPRWMMAVVDASGTLRSVAYLWREGLAPARTALPSSERN